MRRARVLPLGTMLFCVAAACGDDGGGSGGAGGSGTTAAGPTTSGSTTKAQSTTTTGGPMTHCEELCAFFAGLEAMLMCGFDEPGCVTECEMGFATLDPMCADEAEAYNDCLMMEPDRSFQCSPGGGFAWASTVCEAQLMALSACAGG